MARLPHLSGRFGRPRGWRRWVMLSFLLLIVATLGVVLYLASPGRVAKLAGDLLAAMTGTDVRIDSAQLGLDGAITLQGLELRIAGMPSDAAKLFDADQVLIKHDLLSLLKGTFHARTLTFINPALHLTEESDTGHFNYHTLQQQRRAQPAGQPGQTAVHLPEIFIRNGQVRFGQSQDDQFNLVGTMNISGTLTASLGTPGQYDFKMRQHYKDLLSGQTRPVLSGKIDMNRLTVAAKLEQFTFDSPQRIMLPQELRRWWDQLEPVGSLPLVRFGYDPDPKLGFHAELELSGVSITLPYGELDSRMTNVSGRFTIDNDQITITNLSGQIEDLHYTINGQVFGLNRDAPFKLSIRTQPFALPEEPRYLLALPSKFQKHFRRFTPSGNFEALVILERRAPGGRLIYDGVVEVSQAKILYEKFKYPLTDVKGQLRFDDEKIELVALQGRGPTGADVTINGRIAPPQDGAAVHVVVTAVDIPIDQTLYDAIPQQRRPAMDMFFHRPSYQRLIDSGWVQTTQQQNQITDQLEELRIKRRAIESDTPHDTIGLAELDKQIEHLSAQAQTPVFDLGGKTTVSTQVSRALGPKKPYLTTVSLDVSGVQALFKYWPYPLRGTHGRLLITPDKIVVDDAQLRGFNDVEGTLTGTIAPPTEDDAKAQSPQLELAIENVPIDDLLLASIPEPQDQWLRRSHLQGMLNADGVIRQNDSGDVDFQVNIKLDNGTAQPYGGQFHIEHVAGQAVLTTHGFEIPSLIGRRGPGALELSGQAKWQDDHSWAHWDLKIGALDLDNVVIDLLPPDDPATDRIRQLFDTYHPTGTLDATLHYRVKDDQPATYSVDLKPQQLNLVLDDQPIALSDFTGQLTATTTKVELDKWGASFDSGRFLASGQIEFAPQLNYSLTFGAQSDRIDPVTRAMLPEAVVSVIDALSLDGAYEIRAAHLFYDPQQHNSYRFGATAALTNASAVIGVPMNQINANLTIQTEGQTDTDWPKLDLRIDAQSMLAADRHISPLSVRIATGDRPNQLKVHELVGYCYGGTLMGAGEILLGDIDQYRMNLVLQNVALNPFIYPQKYPDGWTDSTAPIGPENEDPYTGTIAASLGIQGLIDPSSALLGRGEVEIRNSNLYEVPLSMALLQLLNISLPASRAFDRASASYVIDNDIVRFDSIRFEAPTIEIIGVGTMQYSTLGLDLDLYTRNPTSPKLGALSDLFRVFKDELLSIHVTGTLDDPSPRATSFQGIKRSWREVFGSDGQADYRPLTAKRGAPN